MKKKVIIIVLIVVALIAGSVAAYFRYFRGNNVASDNQNVNEVDYSEPTDDQKDAGEDIKQENTDYNNNDGKPGEPYNSENEPTNPTQPEQKTVSVEIAQAGKNGSNLRVRAIIQELAGGGTCTLKLEKSGQTTVTKTAGTQAISSYTTCQGFDVPLSSLPAGTWKLTISYARGSVSGSASQEVVL